MGSVSYATSSATPWRTTTTPSAQRSEMEREAEYRQVVAGPSTLEPEIRRIGAELADAFPSSARHPMKALDEKAMEVASRDAELRSALFRFVDVVPACNSLED